MKVLVSAFLFFLSSCLFISFSAQVQVFCDQIDQGENIIKRGYLSSMEEYKNSLVNKFSEYSSEGYQLMMLHRKLNIDYQDSATYLDYIVDATNNSNWIGYPQVEIYSEIDAGDTTYHFHVDDNFVNMLTAGVDAGLEILFQLNGTFPDIERDPNFKRIPYNVRLNVDGSQNGEQHKEFEIPPPSLFEKYNTVLSSWINAIEDSVKIKVQHNSNTNFIWCGSEEITHTIGWPTDSNGDLDSLWLTGNETDSMRKEAKEWNISRYTKMWSGLSKKLDSYGISDAGIQLNAANIDQYSFFRDQLLEPFNQPPMDFIAIQNYKGHKKTIEIVDSLKLVIDNLRSFDSKYNDLKIIFDRYGFKKNSSDYPLSKAACSFLDAEEHIISNSDYFYGYCLMTTFHDSLIGDVAGWLNNTPNIKRSVINLPESIKAMIFSNDEKFNMVIWNNGINTFNSDIELINLPSTYSNFELTVQVDSVNVLVNSTAYNFDYNTKKISGFNLNSDGFALITLRANNFPKSYIPDDNFEAFLESNGMGDGYDNNDSVITSNINNVESLYLVNQNISNLSGIENFSSLTALNCENNSLTNLDISQNTQLKSINCRYNQINSLDLSQNSNLTTLICSDNILSSIDVSQNSSLTKFSCEDNLLTSIDISQNSNLVYFICGDNQITNIDVTNNPLLKYLGFHSNQITNIDVTQNPFLEVLSFGDNQVTKLDLASNSQIKELRFYRNKISCLNMKNGNNSNISIFDGSYNPDLNCIEVDDPNWAIQNLGTNNGQWTFTNNCNYPAGCF